MAEIEPQTIPRTQVTAGSPTLDVGSTINGASWGPNGMIVFDQAERGLWKVPDAGGQPEQVTIPDQEKGEYWHVLPKILPGGKAVLFTLVTSYDRWENPKIAVLSLENGEHKILIEEGADARYVPTGHIVFADRGTLKAVAFDFERLEVAGNPVPVLENVMQAMNASNRNLNSYAALFSISNSGTLAYVPGGVYPDLEFLLDWMDRKGKAHSLTSNPFSYYAPRISPDGRKLVYASEARNKDIYLYDIASGRSTQLTFGGGIYHSPMWTPDGVHITYSLFEGPGHGKIFLMPADRSAEPKLLMESDYRPHPASWTPEEDHLAYVERHPATGNDIWVLRIEDNKSIPIACTEAEEGWPVFSPDGRWIAYTSNHQEGKRQVYVQPFPPTGREEPISIEPGRGPVWDPGGSKLYFRAATVRSPTKVWVVDTSTEPDFTASKPRVLFDYEGYSHANPLRNYDITHDGQAFVFVRSIERELPGVTQINIVLNWFEELKRLCPIN